MSTWRRLRKEVLVRRHATPDQLFIPESRLPAIVASLRDVAPAFADRVARWNGLQRFVLSLEAIQAHRCGSASSASSAPHYSIDVIDTILDLANVGREVQLPITAPVPERATTGAIVSVEGSGGERRLAQKRKRTAVAPAAPAGAVVAAPAVAVVAAGLGGGGGRVKNSKMVSAQRKARYWRRIALDALARERELKNQIAKSSIKTSTKVHARLSVASGMRMAVKAIRTNTAAAQVSGNSEVDVSTTAVLSWQLKASASYVAHARAVHRECCAAMVHANAEEIALPPLHSHDFPIWVAMHSVRADATTAAVWQKTKLHSCEVISAYALST